MSKVESFNPTSFDSAGLQSRAGGNSQAAVGQFAGQQVQVDEVDSMLSDAAEEISLHHAEKAESKHSSERKKEAVRSLEIMGAEAIMAYMDAAQASEDPEQLVHLAKRMLSGMGDPAQHAREAFSGPSEQFMALQYALQQGEREGVAGDILEALRESLQDLEMSHGPAIRADINTVGTARQAGSQRIDIAHFQAAYRDVVLGESTLAATLKMALERFGDKDFGAGLQRLTQALGQDLSSARPSCEPARLQSLVQDLFHLNVTVTVLDGCRQLQDQLAQKHGVSKLSALALMRALVEISAEKWVSAQRFTGLCSSFEVGTPQARIQLLTSVKALLRQMPVQVFNDEGQREGVFAGVQEALDQAIDMEEY